MHFCGCTNCRECCRLLNASVIGSLVSKPPSQASMTPAAWNSIHLFGWDVSSRTSPAVILCHQAGPGTQGAGSSFPPNKDLSHRPGESLGFTSSLAFTPGRIPNTHKCVNIHPTGNFTFLGWECCVTRVKGVMECLLVTQYTANT